MVVFQLIPACYLQVFAGRLRVLLQSLCLFARWKLEWPKGKEFLAAKFRLVKSKFTLNMDSV